MNAAATMSILKWDGQPIGIPGVYEGIPLAQYHGAITTEPAISSSGLRTIEGDSLKHYWMDSYLNPNRRPRPDTKQMAFGRAVHDLAAGEEFRRNYAIRPDQWDSWRTKDAQSWKLEMELAGLTVLTPEDVDAIKSVADELSAHPTIRAGILNGIVEHSIIWPDLATGVWLKARPDVIPTDSNMIVDLKTCSSAHPRAVRRSIDDFNYHMQLALGHWGIQATTGREMTDFVLVFVETAPPYCVNIKPIYPEDIELGMRQLRRALDKFARALETNEWPGYEDDEVMCGISDAYRKRLMADDDAGLLPKL